MQALAREQIDKRPVRSPNDVVLRIDGAAKTYTGNRSGSAVLLPVSAEIGAGEFVSLVGPSGCGKTVRFRGLASRMLPADRCRSRRRASNGGSCSTSHSG